MKRQVLLIQRLHTKYYLDYQPIFKIKQSFLLPTISPQSSITTSILYFLGKIILRLCIMKSTQNYTFSFIFCTPIYVLGHLLPTLPLPQFISHFPPSSTAKWELPVNLLCLCNHEYSSISVTTFF